MVMYPIVNVTTPDGLKLHGLLTEPSTPSKTIIIYLKDAVELLKSENKMAEAYIINDTDHVFKGKENELINMVTDFIKRRILV